MGFVLSRHRLCGDQRCRDGFSQMAQEAVLAHSVLAPQRTQNYAQVRSRFGSQKDGQVIHISESVYEQVMRVIRASNHIEARAAANQMRVAAMKAVTDEIEFNNATPALLQAG
ncbi:MAG: hypothetical protein RB191_11525 [Terriglobia bacterium]|nr:hypothetical protein [Terriglobia bacterium]